MIKTLRVYFAPGGSNIGFGPRTRLATNALFPEWELTCKYVFIHRIADFNRGAELPRLNSRSLRPSSSASLSASWKWAESCKSIRSSLMRLAKAPRGFNGSQYLRLCTNDRGKLSDQGGHHQSEWPHGDGFRRDARQLGPSIQSQHGQLVGSIADHRYAAVQQCSAGDASYPSEHRNKRPGSLVLESGSALPNQHNAATRKLSHRDVFGPTGSTVEELS